MVPGGRAGAEESSRLWGEGESLCRVQIFVWKLVAGMQVQYPPGSLGGVIQQQSREHRTEREQEAKVSMLPLSSTSRWCAQPRTGASQESQPGGAERLPEAMTQCLSLSSCRSRDAGAPKPGSALAVSSPVSKREVGGTSEAVKRLAGPLLAERHRKIAHWDRQIVAHIYDRAPVTDPGLLEHMLYRGLDSDNGSQWLQVSNKHLKRLLATGTTRLVSALVRTLPETRAPGLMRCPETAAVIVRHRPRWFSYMPKEMKNLARLKPLLEGMNEVNTSELIYQAKEEKIPLDRESETLEERIRRSPFAFDEMPDDQVTPELRRLAVSLYPWFLRRFRQEVEEPEYQQLCDLVLEQSGETLGHIATRFRTPARVDRALAHRKPPAIDCIPPQLYTHERLDKALRNDSSPYHYPPSTEFLSEWGLWDAFKTQTDWLSRIEENERTDELYAESIARDPCSLHGVPLSFVERRHPEWIKAFWQMDVYQRMDDHDSPALPRQWGGVEDLYERVYRGIVRRNPLCCVPPVLKEDLPPWALILVPKRNQVFCLSEKQRAMILDNAGSEGLAEALRVPDFHMDPQALLDPMQEAHCSRRAAWLPGQVCKKLAFCHHFRLPRQQDGMNLRDQMDQQTLAVARQVVWHTLKISRPGTAGDWQVRGGRTLVRDDAEHGRCGHLKFQRQGESLAVFAAEEAVQRFALAHQKTLGLRSEIPEPEGIVFVPLEALPAAARNFSDPLEIRNDQRCPGCLAFCFSTRDHSYDTLAWQADSAGGYDKAREGLMRAFHDLGVWSSLGAMHTSTIRLYHHFYGDREARPELVLSAFFNSEKTYPGALHLWNTKAIEASDWGWSGLRDLGDLEFYPYIRCYVESGEGHWTLPGYGQRASFVNALAHNLLGGLLHGIRLHREQPGYHYRNPPAVKAMARLVADSFDSLLHGLLCDGTRLQSLFPDAKTYEQWLPLTAREIVYWTARQNPQENKDCFAQHFADNGRPSGELYPGHPALNCRYGEHFTEAEGETLGSRNGKFPLFFLMRGFYVMAAGLADRLAPAASSGVLTNNEQRSLVSSADMSAVHADKDVKRAH